MVGTETLSSAEALIPLIIGLTIHAQAKASKLIMIRKIQIILGMIKFGHTIFALPFAVMSTFLASKGIPKLDKISWIIVAMVGARSCAMSFNRIADAEIDAGNPRTAMRAIPSGNLKKWEAWIFTIISANLLVLAAFKLNPLAFALSPLALIVIMLYSYTKRFTSLAHLWLGLSLAISPIGAWIAITGQFEILPILLGLAVMFWTAGFDIIYACQDFEFDRRKGLHSIPVKLGIRMSLWISSGMHTLTVYILISIGVIGELGLIYLTGVGIVMTILIYEHVIVKPDDLSRVNLAFFTLNGMVSLILMVLSIMDLLI